MNDIRYSHCPSCKKKFPHRRGDKRSHCNSCINSTSLNTPQTVSEEPKGSFRGTPDISPRPALGVSLPERTTAATNIASDLPEGKEGHVDGVYPKTSALAESAEIAQRIDAAIGRGDHCQNCDEPLVAAISRITKRCPTCTALLKQVVEENVTAIVQNGWVQTQCAQCGNPLVVDIDSFQVICNQCEESNNAHRSYTDQL